MKSIRGNWSGKKADSAEIAEGKDIDFIKEKSLFIFGIL